MVVTDTANRVVGGIRFDSADVSPGGAFLRSDLLFEVGELLRLEFQLPNSGSVSVEVLDVAGRRMAALLENQAMAAGSHRLRWDGRDATGRRVTPGIYLVRIAAGAEVAVRRIVMIH